jgi:hypothetical protein
MRRADPPTKQLYEMSTYTKTGGLGPHVCRAVLEEEVEVMT